MIPVWDSETGRDSEYELDLDQEFDLDASGDTLIAYLIGDPLAAEELLQLPTRQILVKAEIGGETYDSSQIIDFEVDNSLTDEFLLGTTTISMLTMRLRTNNIIPPNAKVNPYFAMVYAGEQATDWEPLGEFYVDNRKEQNGIWTYECLDALVYADIMYISSLSYPATMQAVWDEICGIVGLTSDSTVVIDSYTVPAAPTGYTARQVMGFIAGANSASVLMRRDGRVGFRVFDAADEPTRSMTGSNYIRATPTNPVKTYTRLVVTYNDDNETYEAGSGDDNHTLYLDNPLATQTIVDNLLTKINGLSYLPVDIDAIGNPLIDPGETIGVSILKSMPWEDADIGWEDADFPWDGASEHKTIALMSVHTFKGGFATKLKAPSVSEQSSEFQVDGSLTAAVGRLNQAAVKKGRPVHGVTISPDYGIRTALSDNSASLTINSDVLLDWTVGGVRKLYYDEDTDAIKFTGVIEATEFIGGSIEIGDNFSVNGTGHLKAVGGEFSGTISASTIVGGSIYGATITGSLIQTSGTNPRAYLSTSAVAFGYDYSSTKSVKLGAGTGGIPTLGFNDGDDGTLFQQSGDSFIMHSYGKVVITAPGGLYVNGNFIA